MASVLTLVETVTGIPVGEESRKKNVGIVRGFAKGAPLRCVAASLAIGYGFGRHAENPGVSVLNEAGVSVASHFYPDRLNPFNYDFDLNGGSPAINYKGSDAMGAAQGDALHLNKYTPVVVDLGSIALR